MSDKFGYYYIGIDLVIKLYTFVTQFSVLHSFCAIIIILFAIDYNNIVEFLSNDPLHNFVIYKSKLTLRL